MKRAIIFDLDNTLYQVTTIGDNLFAPLFKLIEESREHNEEMQKIKDDVMSIPFQKVAEKYKFSDELKQKGTAILRELTVDGDIEASPDYEAIKAFAGEKYLVTTGFTKMQWSKIKGMGIENDFTEVHVVDPEVTEATKKDVFADIMQRHMYSPEEILVVGDDPGSELDAAKSLGLATVLIDKTGKYKEPKADHRITSLYELKNIIG